MEQQYEPEKEKEQAPPPPEHEREGGEEQPKAMELAGQIGNRNMQEIANNPDLQQAPGARDLGPSANAAGAEAFAPAGGAGEQLLQHEAAHTTQQGAGQEEERE